MTHSKTQDDITQKVMSLLDTTVQAESNVDLTYYKDQPKRFGLCAWCQYYWNRATGKRHSRKLSNSQYREVTIGERTSHGCCPQCVIELKKEYKETEAVK